MDQTKTALNTTNTNTSNTNATNNGTPSAVSSQQQQQQQVYTPQTHGYASAYSTSLTQPQVTTNNSPATNTNNYVQNSNNNNNISSSNDGHTMISQKRSANDEGMTYKRPRITTKIDLRCLLPSKDAGAIIGRGGNNIKRLRTEHRTIIQVPDCDGPERLLLIGGEMDAVLETIIAIIPLLEDNQKFSSLEFQAEVRMLLHQSQAGCVIGRAGDKIKDLRLRHNLDMKVYSDCCPQSTERVCQMKGKPQEIVACMREILELMDASPPKGPTSLYDPLCYNEADAMNYGGFVSDRKGYGPSVGGSSSGGGGGGGGNRGKVSSSGGSSGYNAANNHQSAGHSSNPVNPYEAYMAAYAQYYGYGANNTAAQSAPPAPPTNTPSQPSTYSSTYNSGPITSTQVTIPNRLAGAIIGPRGTKIQSIREQSQAGITIDKPQPGSDDRIITITGTQEQIQNAQYLLQMTVKQSGLWNGN